jgi:hypothetical protein
VAAAAVPVYGDEFEAIRGELTTPGRLASIDDGTLHVLVAMCHRLRDEIRDFLESLGATTVDEPDEIAEIRSLMGG